MDEKFFYFAYGSNLLARRIHVLNPTAVRAGVGKLQDYQLDFMDYSEVWKGPPANIVHRKGAAVWGAIWELDDMENLDKQEGVHVNFYLPRTLDVESSEEKRVKCRTYQQMAIAPEIVQMKDLPENRRPTPAYLRTIIEGAKESELPEEYLKFLESIPHNGKEELTVDLRYIYTQEERELEKLNKV